MGSLAGEPVMIWLVVILIGLVILSYRLNAEGVEPLGQGWDGLICGEYALPRGDQLCCDVFQSVVHRLVLPSATKCVWSC
jgi:hypothetical protein